MLQNNDPKLADMIAREATRQDEEIELIASENYVSKDVLEANGSILTNKYAEGYSGRRYYWGCDIIDEVETLAIDRAKELFGAEHVNVQPLSGSPAILRNSMDVLDNPSPFNLTTLIGLRLSSCDVQICLNSSGFIFQLVPNGWAMASRAGDKHLLSVLH